MTKVGLGAQKQTATEFSEARRRPSIPIQRFEVERFGCIRRASFELSPLHALIGPNDSGKSTALHALQTAASRGSHAGPFDSAQACLTLRYADQVAYRVRLNGKEVQESLLVNNEERVAPAEVDDFAISRGLAAATMIRFAPHALRKPCRQILANEPIRFFDETGEGLAAVYQALSSRDVDAFIAIRNTVRRLFPTIHSILVATIGDNTVGIEARLTNGNVVSAAELSDGLLLFLAYEALKHLTNPGLILVEAPENGLHPARIAEVMTILRNVSKQSQVIIATHSPLAVNELGGNEVSVLTRDPEEGTRVTLLNDVPGFDDAAKVYQLGEFWVSYCDGDREEALLTGRART